MREFYFRSAAGIAIFLVIALVVFLFSQKRKGVYYCVTLAGIQEDALPSPVLDLRTSDGRLIWTVDCQGEESVCEMLYFPHDATMALVCSGNVVVASAALQGEENRDNFLRIVPIPQ